MTEPTKILMCGDREALAWAAGVFDGEGHVGHTGKTETSGSRNRLYLDVSQSGQETPEMLIRLRSIFGFGVVRGPFGPYGANRKPVWRYEISDYEHVQAMMAAIWPWLGGVKRQQFVDAITAFRENHHPRGWRKVVSMECAKGHPFDGVRKSTNGRTKRTCSICARTSWQKWNEKKRAAS